jgi:hypothetical protein
MNILCRFQVVIAVSAICLSSCVMPPGFPGPGLGPDHWGDNDPGGRERPDDGNWGAPPEPQPDAGGSNDAERRAFKQGYKDGLGDAQRNLTAEVQRHGLDYQRSGNRAEFQAYSNGYSRGYGDGRRSGGGDTAAVRAAFQAGYDDGLSDGRSGLTAEVGRHGASYHRSGREAEYDAYCSGYSKGYGEGKRSRGNNANGTIRPLPGLHPDFGHIPFTLPDDAAVRAASQAGYRDGLSDAQRGLTAEVLRHGASYHRAGHEAEYRAYSNSYAKGFGEGRRNRR